MNLVLQVKQVEKYFGCASNLIQLPLQKYSIGISILYNQKGLANEKSLA